MFSSNPFGQSSSSPFGSQPVFGQTSYTSFGSTSTFGSQTGSSIFGGTSTGVFGQSSAAFGASSSPAFGSSMPSFGAATTPAFGGSLFGQKPTFGGFGSTTNQSSPFGSTFQQTQSAFGSNPFGSTTFGASSQPAFGSSSAPTFGSTAAAPAFGAASTPVFGATSTPAFGSTSTPAFGSTSTPPFGSASTPAFGSTSTPLFGSTGTTFGVSSAPAFGSTATSAFGAQTTTPTFGSPGFGQTGLGGQQLGSRVVPYSPTQETDAGGTQPAGKLETISAMPQYKDKSHEELRWEDYQRGDKGGPNLSGQPAGGLTFPAPAQANPFGSTSTFGQPTANPFSSATSSNPFAPKTPSFGSPAFGTSSPFGSLSSGPFASTSSTPSLFGTTSNTAFSTGSSPPIFGGTTTAVFGSTGGSSSAFGSGLNFGNTQSSGLFQSSTPSLGLSTSPFGRPAGFQQTTPAFGSNPFSASSTGFGGSLFNSSASMFSTSNPGGFGQTTQPSLTTPFQPSAPAQLSGAFSFSNFGQMQPASSGFGGTSSIFNQGTFGQSFATQPNMVMQPAPVTNPFGTLPAMPQMSIGRTGSSPSVQYGISSMPVSEKPVSVRISSLLSPRHLSQRRINLPARKYHPKNDGQRVPFFSDDEATSAAPKADALFIPRENPRSLIIRPIEQWPPRTIAEKQSLSKDSPVNRNGDVLREPSAPLMDETAKEYHDEHPTENGNTYRNNNTFENTNGVPHDDHSEKESDLSYIKISGHRGAGEAAIAYEHRAGIEALMPKLRHANYYTEPPIQELAAKERAEPGFCRHVKDFVVGKRGFGSIRFFGETDVRRLDLESIVQFNIREVIVYKDEEKKPAVGQGLNKPAEVTLLNVKCVNKRTGEQFTVGPQVEKYKEMLKDKAEEQGAEFVSYDPVKGEWKFRVKHFSSYELGDGDTDLFFL